jgi:hypothetical protein
MSRRLKAVVLSERYYCRGARPHTSTWILRALSLQRDETILSRAKRFGRRGRADWRLEHAGEIQNAYRGQRRFPPALGAESADPSILIRPHRGVEAGCPYPFDQDRPSVSLV